jgi:hypothetical protein
VVAFTPDLGHLAATSNPTDLASHRPPSATKDRRCDPSQTRAANSWTGSGVCQSGSICFAAAYARYGVTVTRRNVAGMEVVSLLELLFWLLNKASNSFCRSAARPFFSAASKAFMVGP